MCQSLSSLRRRCLARAKRRHFCARAPDVRARGTQTTSARNDAGSSLLPLRPVQSLTRAADTEAREARLAVSARAPPSLAVSCDSPRGAHVDERLALAGLGCGAAHELELLLVRGLPR